MHIRIRNLRRTTSPAMSARETVRRVAAEDSPASIIRVRLRRAGVRRFRSPALPGTRLSMTGARTPHHRCCRHHRASGHRSRRTIAVANASEHMLHGSGAGFAPVWTVGCFVLGVVDKGL